MLTVRGLHVSLDGAPILRGIDLDVVAGEWVTVIGPNGAGKSTLLRAFTSAVPYTGTVLLNGTNAQDLPQRKRAQLVATVAQQPVVPSGMNVLDYVLLGRTPYIPLLGRESAADVSIVEHVLAQLALSRFASRALETLSGGERQRVFMARALAQQAPLLLLDEPTSALDIGHQQEVLELVDALRKSHELTVIATMHDLSIAGEYAERLVLLAEGEVVISGRPSAVLTEELLERHYRARVRVIEGDFGPIIVPVRQ